MEETKFPTLQCDIEDAYLCQKVLLLYPLLQVIMAAEDPAGPPAYDYNLSVLILLHSPHAQKVL